LTQFDFIVLALLLLSAGVGFARGAVREIAALFALVAAAAAAVFGLRFYAPIAHKLIHTDWLATTVGLIVVFCATYLVLRIMGAAVARRIQEQDFMGALDRTLGLAIGLARGLIVLGALQLMFVSATPPDLRPHWITGAKTWPLANNMGRLLTSLAPQGLDIAGRLKPAFDRAVHEGTGDRSTTGGYEARQRGELEDLVEKSR
jgi:membrane protein required for colicin V production